MATTQLTIDEQAQVLGRAVRLQRDCFAAAGHLVRPAQDPAVKLALAAVSRHCGEHALALERLLPSTRDHDPTAIVATAQVAPDEALDPAAVGVVVPGVVSGDSTLVGMVRNLLELATDAHEATVARLTPVADAPAIRVLGAILAEGRSDLRALDTLPSGGT